MKPALRVDPSLVNQFSVTFGQLVAAFENLSVVARDDVGDTGDSRLSQAIEQFLDSSTDGIKQLSTQFGQLEHVLSVTVQGYETMEEHIASEIEANL